MPRSPAKKRKGGRRGAGGSRLQTVGLFLTLLLVAGLVASAVWGGWEYFQGRSDGGASPGAARGGETRPEPARGTTTAPAQRIRVEVLNASGRQGLAGDVREMLRDSGFDVVSVGNAPREFGPDTSVVLDRVGRPELARQVAGTLGIARVHTRPDANVVLEVTVVLGKDWRGGPAADAQ